MNLVHQQPATLFGGIGHRAGVRRRPTPFAGAGWAGRKQGYVTAEAAERAAAQLPSAMEIVTVEEALDMRAVYRSTTLVSMRSPNLRLFQEAVARVRGCGEQAVYLLFVDEIPGLFFPPKTGPSREAQDVLASGVEYFRQADIVAIPIWRMAHDAGRLHRRRRPPPGGERGAGGHLPAQRRLAPAARQRAQVADRRSAQGHPGLDLQLTITAHEPGTCAAPFRSPSSAATRATSC